MTPPTSGGRRGRHRRRWTATGLVLGVPAVLVPYLLYAQEDSQAATVDDTAYYRLVSVRSGKVPTPSAPNCPATPSPSWTPSTSSNLQVRRWTRSAAASSRTPWAGAGTATIRSTASADC
jgi:hypothetical protein